MTSPKLRLVFYEDENTQSYFHLERAEGLRVIEILKIIKGVKQWTPVSEIAKRMNTDPVVLRWTIIKLPGAKYIDLELNGKRKVIARAPVMLIKKNYTRNNPQHKYLRSAIYVKAHS